MARTQRSILIAAISLLCLFSLPQAATAQTIASGTWSGWADYSVTYYDGSPGYSFSEYTTLTVGFRSYDDAYVAGPPGFGTVEYDVTSFGLTSASGFTFAGGLAPFSGNFDISYQSILPDGQIDTTGGFAVADYTAGLPGEPFVGYYYASFQSAVPEPLALVQVAIAAIVIAAFVGIRKYRAGEALARARALGVALQAQSSQLGVSGASGPG
jgi:hypothetical protein